MSKNYSMTINFNGKVRFSCPEEHQEQVKDRILQHLNNALLDAIQDTPVAEARLESGEFWNAEGIVNLGDLIFDVAHCPKQGISGACVDITPEPGAYGHEKLKSRVAAYVSKHSAYLTSKDLNGTEKLLAQVSIKGGDLVVQTMVTGEQNDDGALPAVVVPIDNCIRKLH